VQQILNESQRDGIPASDGGREVYYIVINRNLIVSSLKRALVGQLRVWDNTKNIRIKGLDSDPTVECNYDETLKRVTKICEGYAWASAATMGTWLDCKVRLQPTLDEIASKLQPFKDMPGVWKIMSIEGNLVDNSMGVFLVGFEIDMVRYKMGHILDAGSEGVSEEDNILDW